MTDVTFDGQAVTAPLTGREKVGDVIGSIAKDLDTRRCIIQVHLDGEEITGKADRHMEPIGMYRRLDIKSGTRSDLALESLDSLTEFHGSLLSELSRAAEEFRLGNEEKANNIFVRCLDGIEILVKTTSTITTLMDQNPQKLQLPDGTLGELNGRVNALFDEMIEAQTQRDSILLADLIEYELLPLLEDWKNAFSMIRELKVPA